MFLSQEHGAFKGEGPKVVDKFDGMNFHLWKFKMQMVLAEKELWEIVKGSEEPHFSSIGPKVRIAYNRFEKKAFAILALSLFDSQLYHVRSYKTSTEVWAKVCDIHEAKKLGQYFVPKAQVLYYQERRGPRQIGAHQQSQGSSGPTQ